jgi:hypothetical protein
MLPPTSIVGPRQGASIGGLGPGKGSRQGDALVFVWKFVPETKGKELEAM